MGIFGGIKYFVGDTLDVVEDVAGSTAATIGTAGFSQIFAKSATAAKDITGITSARRREDAAETLEQAQNRILDNRTLRQVRQQTRQARAGRAGVQNARAVGGLGQDSSVSATAVSSNRAQLSFNLAQLRNSLENQRVVADAKEEIQEASQPTDLQQAFGLATKAAGVFGVPSFDFLSGGGSGVTTNAAGNAPTTNNFLDDFT